MLKVTLISDYVYIHLGKNDDVNVEMISCLFKMPSNIVCIYLVH